MLGETTYAESFTTVEDPTQVDRGLLREMGKTYDLLDRICPDRAAIGLFRKRHDFHNLKAMLKSKITGVPYEDSVVALGTYGVDRLGAAVQEDNYRFAPPYVRDTALAALAEYERMGTVNVVGYTCERSMWCHLIEQARANGVKLVVQLFREYVDLTNIKTFLRMRECSENLDEFDRYFIPGGSHPIDFYLRHRDEELGLFLHRLATQQYERHIVSEGLMMWPEDRSFWRLEIAFDNYILLQFQEMRFQLFSIAPLLYYLLRREAEARLIRTVIRCKLAGMVRQQIEERLEHLYV